MTYSTGASIDASDFNTFATALGGINEVYADLHSGDTTLAQGANFGYGITPPLAGVTAGNPVLASQWELLFNAMRAVETHQGSNVTPPVPASGPAAADEIVAINTPTLMADAVATLITNRNNLAAGQTTLTVGTAFTTVSSWTNQLTYSFQANFGSWNNARYFFNTGGSLQIVGSYVAAATPIEIVWRDTISSPRAPFTFRWNNTSAASGGNSAPLRPIGFWRQSTGNPLTTSYQVVFRGVPPGGGYYGNQSIEIDARLAAAAGTNGLVDFRIRLIDNDPSPDPKSPGISFTVNRATSSGAIPYPGPAVIITNGGFIYA